MGKDVGLKITNVRLAGIEPDGLSIAKLTGQLIQRDRNEQRHLSFGIFARFKKMAVKVKIFPLPADAFKTISSKPPADSTNGGPTDTGYRGQRDSGSPAGIPESRCFSAVARNP